LTGEQLPAKLGECQIGFTGYDVIGQGHDGLRIELITDLGPAENDSDVRPQSFDDGDDFGGGSNVPDVNAKPDNFRIPCQENLGDIRRTLVDIEFQEASAGAEGSEICEQVAQPESGVNVFGIQGGQDDVGHWRAI